MQLLLILLVQVVLIVVGLLFSLASGVVKKSEALGLSYLLGSGIVSLLFLLFHWLGKIPLSQFNFFLSLLTSSFTLIAILAVTKKLTLIRELVSFQNFKSLTRLSKMEKVMGGTIILLVSYSFMENYFWPIFDWDALAFYDFRARVMALRGNMLEGIDLGYFFQYPPYTSFLHVFGYILGAERVKIAYSFIYFSLLLTFYSLLRRKQDQFISLTTTLILASTPMIFEHATMAYSNLAYSTFFSLGIIYLWFYVETGLKKDLIIGGLLVGLSTWVRSTEPFWIAGLLLIIWGYLTHKTSLILHLSLAGWLSLPNQIWRMYLQHLDQLVPQAIEDTQSHATSAIKDFFIQNQNVSLLLIRVFEVLKYLVVVLSPEFLFLFFLFALTFYSNAKNKLVESITMLVLLSIVFAGTFIFSFTFDTWNQIGGSIVRMCMIFIPLLLFVIVKDLSYEKK